MVVGPLHRNETSLKTRAISPSSTSQVVHSGAQPCGLDEGWGQGRGGPCRAVGGRPMPPGHLLGNLPALVLRWQEPLHQPRESGNIPPALLQHRAPMCPQLSSSGGSSDFWRSIKSSPLFTDGETEAQRVEEAFPWSESGSNRTNWESKSPNSYCMCVCVLLLLFLLFLNLKISFLYNFEGLLSIYSYYKMLAIFPMLCNTPLGHLTPSSLYPPLPHHCITTAAGNHLFVLCIWGFVFCMIVTYMWILKGTVSCCCCC